MKYLKKFLYLIPLLLLIVGCSKKTTANTTKNKTTNNKTSNTNTTIKTTTSKRSTTTRPTTTEKKFNVTVTQSKANAATITGVGKFTPNSSTTITIEVNEGFDYLGLFDGDVELTKELTYDITNITSDINLEAKFSAYTYTLTCSSYDEYEGGVDIEGGDYECGSSITITASPLAEGYEFDYFLFNDGTKSTTNPLTLNMPAEDITVVAYFKVIEFSVTITDNISNTGEFFLEDSLYTGVMKFDYNELVYLNVYDVHGYRFSYMTINGEKIEDSYYDLQMLENFDIKVYYELDDMYFYLLYDLNRLQASAPIIVSPLPDDYQIDSYYGYEEKYEGFSFLRGYYKYKTKVTVTIKVNTSYNFEGVIDLSDGEKADVTVEKLAQDNYKITFTVTNDTEYLIDLLGKMVTLTAYAKDEETGTVAGAGNYHYNERATLDAIPAKGYKFLRWENQNGVVYIDLTSSSVNPKLVGNATYVAVFVPRSYQLSYYMVNDKETKRIDIEDVDYLNNNPITPKNVPGYSFKAWLNSDDKTDILTTDESREFMMPNDDTSVYAYYEPNTYTVTFDFNGGIGTTTTITVTYGELFETPEVPTRENLTFQGYKYCKPDTVFVVETTSGTTKLDYYLRSVVEFYPNGLYEKGLIYVNDIVADAEADVTDGDIITIKHEVEKYATDELGKSSSSGYTYAGDCIFVAQWGVGITYKFNNGEEDGFKVVNIGDTIYKYFEDPTREGYTYQGFMLDGEVINLYTTHVYKNVVIEAKWEAINYAITYSERYGHFEDPVTKAHIDDVITIKYVMDENYTFEYIEEKVSGVHYTDLEFEFTMPARDVRFIVHAQYYIIYSKVEESGMGTVDKSSDIVEFGKYTQFTATPKEGYGFVGWFVDGACVETSLTISITPLTLTTWLTAKFGSIITDNYERLGNKIYFGTYPQTYIDKNISANQDLLTALKTEAGDLPLLDSPANYNDTKDDTNWHLYEDYYFYPGVPWNETYYDSNYNLKEIKLNAPHMWYIDIVYDNVKYRGVQIYTYRTDEISKDRSPKSTSYTHQDDNGFSRNEAYQTYWFRYEKIEWDIIENNDGTCKLISNLALDSQNFSLDSNAYTSSYIRQFLIDNFYHTAFSESEALIMNTMNINGNDDYVTLLSQEEAQSIYTTDEARITKATEYAQSQNVCMYSKSYYDARYADCYWLTRSNHSTAKNIYYVTDTGSVTNGYTYMTYYGIRPVISINL